MRAHFMPRLTFPRPVVTPARPRPLPDAYRTVQVNVRKAPRNHVIRGAWA